MRRTLSLVALSCSLLAAAACGADGETGEDFDYGLDAGVRADGSATGDGGLRDGGDGGDGGASTGDGGALSDGAATGDGGGASTDASVGDGGARTDGGATADAGPPDAGLPDLCAATAGCAAGASIGSVSGDTGSDFLQRTGTASTWLLVRVKEDDDSWFSRPPVRARFTLTHNVNTRFDLFLYKAGNNGGSTRNCSSVTAAGSRGATSNLATASLSWEDTTGIGGEDNSANVMVEIRHVSGPCGAGREWQLQVEGNAQ
jgi:hypothetical protein